MMTFGDFKPVRGDITQDPQAVEMKIFTGTHRVKRNFRVNTEELDQASKMLQVCDKLNALINESISEGICAVNPEFFFAANTFLNGGGGVTLDKDSKEPVRPMAVIYIKPEKFEELDNLLKKFGVQSGGNSYATLHKGHYPVMYEVTDLTDVSRKLGVN